MEGSVRLPYFFRVYVHYADYIHYVHHHYYVHGHHQHNECVRLSSHSQCARCAVSMYLSVSIFPLILSASDALLALIFVFRSRGTFSWQDALGHYVHYSYCVHYVHYGRQI